MDGHGGIFAAGALKAAGVETVFTLSGGHLFPLYDGCVQAGIDIVDTRHEQTAVFAAEGWAKLTRRPGVAAVTAGPGVTNAMSAIATGHFTGSPLLVIGGRAPVATWGTGSIQEIDHLPLLSTITRRATTARSTESVGEEIAAALAAATSVPRGPAFVDVPFDLFLSSAKGDEPAPPAPVAPAPPDPAAIAAVAKLIGDARRPVVMAGAGVYWAGAEDSLREMAEELCLPVFTQGLGRGTIPASHPLAFSRCRGSALKEADLVVVAGTPLDFRLGFGRFGAAKVVHLCEDPGQVAMHVELAGVTSGDLSLILRGLAGAGGAAQRADWRDRLRVEETAKRNAEETLFASGATPIHPARIYGELRRRMAPDAVVIGDGGDFVSYAGKYVDTETPGCFLDPGPYGCLGTGPGYALAARRAHPDRQVFLLLGDGAAGFSIGDFDTLVRFGTPVVAIVGNNNCWGLEKHPMQAMYGYHVAAELRPDTRYDQVVTALGGHGELVTHPDEIGPAIDRALAADAPALINVMTDPENVYPRSSLLV